MGIAMPLVLTLACILLAILASTASASPYDIRGEWSVELSSAHEPTLAGKAILNKEEPGGEFTGSGVLGGFITAPFSGTVTESETSLTIVAEAPGGDITFMASALPIDTTQNTFAGTGAYYKEGKLVEPGNVKATRLKSYKQIEEQEAQEKLEREEREARANVRGEWSLTLEAGPEKLKGIALITEQANAENKFASKSALFEGALGGTFSGTLEGTNAKVTVTTEGSAALSLPPGTFTSETIAVSSKANPTSMSGSGKFTVGEVELTGTLVATRIRTYKQIEEQEAKEREPTEKLEEEARIAKEKVEREAKEKAELEVKEKREREAREALEKATKAPPSSLPIVTPKPAVPVLLATTTSTASHSGGLSLKLTNPNGSMASGHLKLTFTEKAASTKHASGHGKSKTSTLGEASFSIVPGGNEVVKLTLTKSGRTELAHLKTMHVLVTLTTQVSGQPTTTKVYNLTLHSGSTHRKG
jgi:hypothetical protein